MHAGRRPVRRYAASSRVEEPEARGRLPRPAATQLARYSVPSARPVTTPLCVFGRREPSPRPALDYADGTKYHGKWKLLGGA